MASGHVAKRKQKQFMNMILVDTQLHPEYNQRKKVD